MRHALDRCVSERPSWRSTASAAKPCASDEARSVQSSALPFDLARPQGRARRRSRVARHEGGPARRAACARVPHLRPRPRRHAPVLARSGEPGSLHPLQAAQGLVASVWGRAPGGAGFRHETYRRAGGMDAAYLNMPPIGLASFAASRPPVWPFMIAREARGVNVVPPFANGPLRPHRQDGAIVVATPGRKCPGRHDHPLDGRHRSRRASKRGKI